MMRIAHALPLVAAATLSLYGCFGGADEKDSNPVNPQVDNKTVKPISPGFYVGDYSPFDSTGRWESEFTLSQNGTYRFYWIISNEAIGDIKGNWFQRDSGLYFHNSGETYMNQNTGFFDPHMAIENDTNAIRDVTDSSFTRKEWTLLRQKPFWVTYRKKSLPGLGNGKYEYTQVYKIDDTTNTVVKIRIDLEGTGFLYHYKEDTLESFQAMANWYLLGTVFTTEENKGRSYVDSLKDFAPWDPLPGNLLQRIRVSDTAFEMWYPGGFASPPRWDVYRKVE